MSVFKGAGATGGLSVSEQRIQSPTINSNVSPRLGGVGGAVSSDKHRRSAKGIRNTQDVSNSVKPSYAVSELVISGHTKPISCLKFSPDGKRLASSSVDQQIRLYETGVFKFEKALYGHKLGLSDVAWSSDSNLLVSASDDKTLKVWDVHTGLCIRTLVGHYNYVFCCDFNFNSDLIVSGSYDCEVRLWTAETGQCARVLTGHNGPVTCVRFNPDGKLVVSSSYDKACRIWDIQTGNCLKYLFAKTAVSFAVFSPTTDRDRVLFASLDSVIRLWNYDGGVSSSIVRATIAKKFKGHVNKEWCINLSEVAASEAKWLVSGSEDGSIYIWDYETGEIVQKLTDGHSGEVLSVACHPTQNIIASADLKDYVIRVWKTYKEM